MYHRVADLDVDPWGLAVRPRDFERHIRLLSTAFNVVPLAALQSAARRPHLRPPVAITFDDGYADNFENAWPILQRYKVPATFFIPSGPIETGREFWWDTLERAFLSDDTTRRLHGRWRVTDPAPTDKHRSFLSLWARMRELHPAQLDVELAELRDRTGPHGPATGGPMSAEQLRSLSRSPLVEVGAHTVSHRRLSAAPEADQREEIGKSKKTLEAICGRPVIAFSYPFGGRDDYTQRTVDLVRASGYERAYTACAAPVPHDCDAFQVPRCFVVPGGVTQLLRSVVRWLRAPLHVGGSRPDGF